MRKCNLSPCLAAVILACAAACPVRAQAPAGKDPLSLLPPDTLLFAYIDDVSAAREAFKKTTLWDLYKDPALQSFVAPAETKIRKAIDDSLANLWKTLKIEAPEEDGLPWPSGRAMVAVELGTRTVQVPEYDWENYDWQNSSGPPPVKGTHEMKVPHPKVLFAADMGDNIDRLRAIVTKVQDKATDEGYRHETRTVRDLELHVFHAPKDEKADDSDGPEAEAFSYFIVGNTAYASTDADLLKDTAARLTGAVSDSLADNAACVRTMRTLGAPGDLTLYVNVRAYVEMVLGMGADEEQGEPRRKMMAALGLDNVTGLGVVVRAAPNDAQQFQLKALLGVDGPKRGIPALLAPTSAATSNPMLTKGLAGFLVANYDFGSFYERIRKIVLDMSGQDIDESLNASMVVTGASPGEAPVDLAGDVFGQLAAPLVVRNSIDKPYTDPKLDRTVVSVGVKDPRVVEQAIGRLHKAMTGGDEDMHRELLNTHIYLMPNIAQMVLGGMMGGMPSPTGGQDDMMALAVPGSNLVIASVESVEQEIRNTRKEDVESIRADEMYQLAATALPAEAGIWFYLNDRLQTESTWAEFKDAAARSSVKAELPANCPVCDAPLNGAEVCPECGTDVRRYAEEPSEPLGAIVHWLKDYCDFNALPDFDAVSRHFGASAGFVRSTDDGIYAECVTVKPKAPSE
jgi:hypothetical protein